MLVIFLLLTEERCVCFLDERKSNNSSGRVTISIQSIIFLIQVTAAWLIIVILCSKFAVAVNEVKELLETSGKSLHLRHLSDFFFVWLGFFFWCLLEWGKCRVLLRGKGPPR